MNSEYENESYDPFISQDDIDALLSGTSDKTDTINNFKEIADYLKSRSEESEKKTYGN